MLDTVAANFAVAGLTDELAELTAQLADMQVRVKLCGQALEGLRSTKLTPDETPPVAPLSHVCTPSWEIHVLFFLTQ